MTLDEAIEIYEIRANTHEREAEYHRPLGYSHEAVANVAEMQAREERQIAKWLKELKERRADRKTEPQTAECPFDDAIPCEWVCTEYGKCKYKDEPQTEVETMSCQECKHWDCINGKWECVLNECGYEPQTERSE